MVKKALSHTHTNTDKHTLKDRLGWDKKYRHKQNISCWQTWQTNHTFFLSLTWARWAVWNGGWWMGNVMMCREPQEWCQSLLLNFRVPDNQNLMHLIQTHLSGMWQSTSVYSSEAKNNPLFFIVEPLPNTAGPERVTTQKWKEKKSITFNVFFSEQSWKMSQRFMLFSA